MYDSITTTFGNCNTNNEKPKQDRAVNKFLFGNAILGSIDQFTFNLDSVYPHKVENRNAF